MNGTITVPDSSYWSFLLIGTFSGDSAGTYPQLDIDDNSLNDVHQYRVVYSDLDDGSNVGVLPMGGTSSTISGAGATTRTYSFELPPTIPGEDQQYYFAAWCDGNANGVLDLKDANLFSDAATAALGEYNRCATKDTYNNSDQPTTIVITGFAQSVDANLNPSGNYKYTGYDTASTPYNEQLELDGAHDSGFNFAIAANSGW